MSAQTKSMTTGLAAAAMIAAGIGTLTIGLMTTGAEISAGLKNALKFYAPSGPLSGKTTVGIVVWLVGWILLSTIWKNKQYNLGKAFNITLVLIALGLLLTFPPLYTALAPK